jgi:hypothetical protein
MTPEFWLLIAFWVIAGLLAAALAWMWFRSGKK